MQTFENPVIAGFYPDPSVTRVGEDYYLVTSSFEYFPGVPIFHSRDLVNWKQIGHCLTHTSQLPLSDVTRSDNVYATTKGFNGGIYAATIRYFEGQFIVVTTNVTIGSHFYVTSKDPFGPWSDPIWVAVPEVGASIDPSIFIDDDGTAYFTCNGTQPHGIYQFVIDLKTGKRLSEVRRISGHFVGKSEEGPHLYRINGSYYLLTAEGGTEYGHLIAIGRSHSPWGPFESSPFNPLLSHRSFDSPIQCTGHGDLFQAHDGSWWLVFLAVRPNGYPPTYHLGRETFLAPVRWSDDGWPVVGDNGRIPSIQNSPSFFESRLLDENVHDDFDDHELALDWNFLRNPDPKSWSLSERSGWLCLHGSQTSTLNQAHKSPTFVGRRQRHFNCKVETLVEIAPDAADGEAGLTVFMNEQHHYEIALAVQNKQTEVLVRRRIGDLWAVTARLSIATNHLKLSIDADKDQYTFYATINENQVLLANGETRYLSTEVAGGFTGVYLGMFATTKAYFDYFKYDVKSSQES